MKKLTYKQLQLAFIAYIENQIKDLNNERNKLDKEIEELYRVLERLEKQSS